MKSPDFLSILDDLCAALLRLDLALFDTVLALFTLSRRARILDRFRAFLARFILNYYQRLIVAK